MSEADNHSFAYNKRHGLIWRDTEKTYHPIITEAKCANCGAIENIDNMIDDGDDFFFCHEDCQEEFYGEIE